MKRSIFHSTVCDCIHSWGGLFKLTTSLVKVLLKLQTLISEIHQCFLLKNCKRLLQCKSLSHFFSTQNISENGYKVVIHLKSCHRDENFPLFRGLPFFY